MVNTVDYLVAERLIGEQEERWELVAEIDNVKLGVPDSIRQMIEKQIDHLEADERRLLEAASVTGAEFSALAVAAGLAEEIAGVEARCEELARRHQFIHDCGVQVLPNGEAVGRYGFIHALYRHVLYERVPASRRVQLHRRIGERGEELYRERTSDIAAELAMHFERAANYEQAATYLQQAAENAIRRFAYREAVVLSRRGLELLAKLPDTAERARQELRLQITLGVSLIATEGYAAPSVGSVYLKARQLCQRLGETPEISQVLWGLWTFHTLRADLETALEIARGIPAAGGAPPVLRTRDARSLGDGDYLHASGRVCAHDGTLRQGALTLRSAASIATMRSSMRRTRGWRCDALPPGRCGFSANPIRRWSGSRMR